MADRPPTRQSLRAAARRRRTRQRRVRTLLVGGVVVLVVVALVAWRLSASRTTPPSTAPSTTTSAAAPATSVPATTAPGTSTAGAVEPVDPGPLAAGPGGTLYISDPARQEVLERTAAGRFVVVAGDGTAGYAGDGGPATKAELDDPGGLAVAPGGVLDIADTGNGVVRQVAANGTITTVAGNQAFNGADWVDNGSTATQAALQPHDVTIGPNGDLVIASTTQVLELTGGTLTTLLGSSGPAQGAPAAGAAAVGSSADAPTAIAYGAGGILYVAGSGTHSLMAVSPSGTVSFPIGTANFTPPTAAGLVGTPTRVLGVQPGRVVRVAPGGQATVARISGGPNGLAAAGDKLYVDGPDKIAVLTDDGAHSTVLWRAGGR